MPTNRQHRSLGRLALIALTLVGASAVTAGIAQAQTPRVTPSGMDVPRYVSLKYGQVNARVGPDEEHRLLWIYQAKGLPVQVVAETREWRRICDPEGGVAWVHKRTTDGRRTAMRVQASPLPLRAQPKAGARVTAYLAGRATANLDKCEKGWCRLKAGGESGWAPESEIWGASPRVQCKE
ncbi:SH3 domain-containing protein [Caulobacter sp. AP07]|uniref:SH3 domain-containing protein n=1 Tax=Caulobacter sp. AP07 TaxID=1144304 RepID=UPI000311CCEF|nr:SH3 domain-containing protein [Caulobacter sp. AP07]